MPTGVPVSSSALAFLSTLHVSLALLRRERSKARGGPGSLLLPSFAFAAAPWLLPTPGGLALGFAAHLLWFLACERFSPTREPEKAATREAAPRPASAAASSPRTAGFLPAPVLAVLEETPEIRTFRLARPEGFEFVAGQFLSVRIEAGGESLVRCYTISSAPDSRKHLEITVKRQGRASAALHDSLRPGASLAIRGPGGRFLYPEGGREPVVLIGGGVGITPLMSMIRHAAIGEPSRPVTLVSSARTEADIAFRDELAGLAQRNPQIRVVLAVTRGGESPDVFPGRINEGLLRSVISRPLESLYFVCGPLPMIDSMREILSRIGVEANRVHAEAFEAAVAWAAAAASSGRRPSGRGSAGTSFRLELARTRRAATVAPGCTLLDAAEEAGARIDFSCRSGVCGTCRTRLLRGEIDSGGELDPADRKAGWILPCVALARGDCVLDA